MTATTTTPTPIFPPTLVSPKTHTSLPTGYTCRPLQSSDYNHGHLDVLRDLVQVGNISEEQWKTQFETLRKCNGTYFVLVIVDSAEEEGRIVATGTLVVERKFLFGLGTQGHLEDIAVAADQQGKKLGASMIQALDLIAEQLGCYKTILNCSPETEGFYEKCGYKKSGSEMHHYYNAVAEEYEI
ncbi:hypothetical protein G7Y89_g9082 [Cudoniella acicularis]|uniref:Glucosamine 6-phosphate N-acetyltransferase n=1 Tax=Cudoniella acicularis TaxID=354080 RepID=A0A8H4W0G5_9HELO|nr:hypothetical protein G7Y89_g9082 [Cudoniella acicularis]